MFQMAISLLTLAILTLLSIVVTGQVFSPFDMFYRVQWGGDHTAVLDGGNLVELRLDEYSGAGFESKENYLSGYFHIEMKVPENKSKGIITSFFVSSKRSDGQKHDELDYEFFGTKEEPYLNTNIFLKDDGMREQSIHLWFDPATDFHTYEIMWGVDIVVFFVDRIPIRILRNYYKEYVGFPSFPLKVEASIWNATWAGPVEWNQGPFRAQYRSFSFFGCPEKLGNIECINEKYLWNNYTFSPQEMKDYENVQKKYLFYDYCKDRRKKECDLPPF